MQRLDLNRARELSPPSRAAWIEIRMRKLAHTARACRRLHGRRGLKYDGAKNGDPADESPPSRAAWIEIRISRRR